MPGDLDSHPERSGGRILRRAAMRGKRLLTFLPVAFSDVPPHTARTRVGRAFALVSLAVLGLTACGSGASSSSTDPGLGMPKASVVEDLPVPSTARLDFANEFTKAPGLLAAQYTLSKAQDQKAVVAWYNAALPPGHAWRSWTACSPFGLNFKTDDTTLLRRSWSKGREVLYLTVEKHRSFLRLLIGRDPHGLASGATLSCWP